MPVIIDGCNLLGELNLLHHKNADSCLLENYLFPYIDLRPRKIVVIFDNCDYNSYEKNDFRLNGIRVMYVQPNIQTADDVIIDFIKKTTDPEGVTVVTSDREILDVARLYHCHTLKSDEFLAELVGLKRDFTQSVKFCCGADKELTDSEQQDINDELSDIWK